MTNTFLDLLCLKIFARWACSDIPLALKEHNTRKQGTVNFCSYVLSMNGRAFKRSRDGGLTDRMSGKQRILVNRAQRHRVRSEMQV